LGEWLSRFDWCSFATLTFRPEFSTTSTFVALKRFETFCKGLERDYKCKIFYAVFVEKFKLSEDVHLHCLMMGIPGSGMESGNAGHDAFIEKEAYKDVWSRWFEKWGRCQFLKYASGRGAEYYLTKYVTKEFSDWRVKLK
jgi:hypothetical protein